MEEETFEKEKLNWTIRGPQKPGAKEKKDVFTEPYHHDERRKTTKVGRKKATPSS